MCWSATREKSVWGRVLDLSSYIHYPQTFEPLPLTKIEVGGGWKPLSNGPLLPLSSQDSRRAFVFGLQNHLLIHSVLLPNNKNIFSRYYLTMDRFFLWPLLTVAFHYQHDMLKINLFAVHAHLMSCSHSNQLKYSAVLIFIKIQILEATQINAYLLFHLCLLFLPFHTHRSYAHTGRLMER